MMVSFPSTGDGVHPMVYRDTEVSGENWIHLRGPFLYNEAGVPMANDSLIEAAHLMDEKTLVIADEYGHLETRGYGLYPGLVKVIESLTGRRQATRPLQDG